MPANGKMKRSKKKLATSYGRFAFELDKKLGALDLPAFTSRYSIEHEKKVSTGCTLRGRLAGHPAWYWVTFDDGRTDLRHERDVRFMGMDENLSRFDISRVHGPDPSGLWWRSASGALERAVTWIESIRIAAGIDVAPRSGWIAVHGFACAGELANMMPIASELAEEARFTACSEKRARLERGVEVAQMAVKRFERRRRLAETLLAKWTARLGRRERALVALDRNAEKIRKS